MALDNERELDVARTLDLRVRTSKRGKQANLVVGSAVLLCLEELPVALINGVLPGALAGNTVKVEELPLLARPAELERVRLVRDELGLGDPEEVLGLIGIDAQALPSTWRSPRGPGP